MCPSMLVRQQQEVWMDQQRDCMLRVCVPACQLGLVKEQLGRGLGLPLCLVVVGLSGNAS